MPPGRPQPCADSREADGACARSPDREGLQSLQGRWRNRFNQPMHRLQAPLRSRSGPCDRRDGRVGVTDSRHAIRNGFKPVAGLGLPADIAPGGCTWAVPGRQRGVRSIVELIHVRPASPWRGTCRNGPRYDWSKRQEATLIRPGPALGMASRSANVPTGAGGESR